VNLHKNTIRVSNACGSTGSPSGNLCQDLINSIGLDAAIQLAESFAGTRLYFPKQVKENHAIAEAVGLSAAETLRGMYVGTTIIVPLMREQRAVRYRNLGMSHARIAVRLGITEKGVARLFHRIEKTGNTAS
jgi:CRP-like cAMP-binding protein